MDKTTRSKVAQDQDLITHHHDDRVYRVARLASLFGYAQKLARA